MWMHVKYSVTCTHSHTPYYCGYRTMQMFGNQISVTDDATQVDPQPSTYDTDVRMFSLQ